MDIRINLLPKKKKRPYLLYIITLLLVTIISTLSFFTIKEYLDLKQRSERLAEEISNTESMYQGVLLKWEQVSENINETNYLTYYDILVTELDNYWIPAENFMTELINLLPTNSRVESMRFYNSGEINLLIVFTSKGLLAEYMDNLQNTNFVLDMDIPSITTVDDSMILATVDLKIMTTAGDTDE